MGVRTFAKVLNQSALGRKVPLATPGHSWQQGPSISQPLHGIDGVGGVPLARSQEMKPSMELELGTRS